MEHAKPFTGFDDLLSAFVAAKKAAKQADEALETLRLQVMATAPHNTTDKFKVVIAESTSERLEGLKAIKDKSPSLFKALQSAGCIKNTVSTRLTVEPLGEE